MVKWSGIGCTACRVTFPDSPESCFFGIMDTEQLVSDRRPVPGDFIEREGKEGQIGDYWVNTSGNRIIRLLLQQIQPETRENYAITKDTAKTMRGEYSIQEDPIWEKKTGEED